MSKLIAKCELYNCKIPGASRCLSPLAPLDVNSGSSEPSTSL